MIKVTINHKEIELENPINVAEAVKRYGLGRNMAVWINGKSVLYKDYENHMLADGDNVRIIRISGGG